MKMENNRKKGKYAGIILLLIILTGLSTTCKNPLQDLIAADIAPKYASIVIRLNLDAVQNGSCIIDFGEALIEESVAIDFVIENQGDNELQLTDDPPVIIEDATGAFSITSMPGSRVAAGATTGFTVTFSPAEAGNHIAKVTINSNCEENATYEFSIIGLGLALPQPEIRVTQGAAPIASGGSFDFGSTVINTPKSYSFVIENTGQGDLNITGTPKIAYSGDDAEDFSTPLLPSTPIPTGGSSSFTVELEAPAAEDISAALIIENNDSDEGTYTINLTAEVTNDPEPEINIKQGSTDIPCDTVTGTYEYTFATTTLESTPTDIVFIIENRGTLELDLTGGTRVVLGGTNADQFTIPVQPASPVAVDGSENFTLRFNPTTIGTKTATISIANDDTDENPYTFDISGTAIDPEIDVDLAANGGSYAFADTTLGDTTDVIFTINNPGGTELTLSGSPKVAVSGTHASQYSVIAQPASPVGASGGSTTFTVRFAPTTLGVKNAAVSIESNDGNENPYTFSLSGTGTGPEMDLLQGGTPIVNGASYTFDDTRLDIPTDVVFTIENNGDENLILDGDPKVAISGTNADQFNIQILPSSPIAVSGGSTTFTLQFAPDTIGDKTATVTISNDDYDEGYYSFTINGTAAWAGIQTVDSSSSINGPDRTSITVSGNEVYIGYAYGRAATGGTDVKFTKSTDGGQTWPAENIEMLAWSGEYPSLAVYNSNIYVCCYQPYYNSDFQNDLRFFKSTDSGDTWPSEYIRAVDTSGYMGRYTSLRSSGDDLYVSYFDANNQDLKFAKSSDGGATWPSGSITTIDSTGNVGYDTSIAISGSNVYISYVDQTNYYAKFAKSSDGGVTWPAGNIKILDSMASLGMVPAIAASGNNVFIVYWDPGNALLFTKSTDGGDSWPAENMRIVNATGTMPSIAVADNNIYISYHDGNSLKFTKSTDAGDTWPAGNIKTVDSAADVGQYNSLAVSSTYIYICYADSTNDILKFAKSIDGGVTW